MCKGPPSTQPTGLPGGTSGQEPCQCRRPQNRGSAPGWGRSLRGGKGNPTQSSCWNRMDGGPGGLVQGCKRLRHNGSSLAAARSCRRPPSPGPFPPFTKNIQNTFIKKKKKAVSHPQINCSLSFLSLQAGLTVGPSVPLLNSLWPPYPELLPGTSSAHCNAFPSPMRTRELTRCDVNCRPAL